MKSRLDPVRTEPEYISGIAEAARESNLGPSQLFQNSIQRQKSRLQRIAFQLLFVEAAARLTGDRRLSDGSTIALVDDAAFHDELHMLHRGHILQRITRNGDQIGKAALLDAACGAGHA